MLQQFRRIDPERVGKPAEGADRWVTSAAFEIADIATLHPGVQGKSLLGQTLFPPRPSNIFAKELHHVHFGTWQQTLQKVCPLYVSL